MTGIWEVAGNDDLKKYIWESEYVRFIDSQGCFFGCGLGNVFKAKCELRIKRVTKKRGLEFAVEEMWIYPDEVRDDEGNNAVPCINDIDGFKTKDKAIQFFLGKVEEMKFLAKKDKENIVWDNIRYMWKIDDKGKIISRESC